MVTNQHLAVLQFGQRQLDHFEIVDGGLALWAVVQNDAVVDGHGVFL
jgi:hypothetical protein